MGDRIPQKGTVEYRRYWRDKRILEEIDRVLNEVAFAAEETEPPRRQDFAQARALMVNAKLAFKAGWKKPYIVEVVKP
jgi:hypothetical protein